MWDIWYITILLSAYYVYDFLYTKKLHHGTHKTDSERVKLLYGEIKKLNKNILRLKTNYSIHDSINLHTKTSLQTMKTLVLLKHQNLMTNLLSPKNIGEHLIILPYYLAGNWYNAIVKHSNQSSRIIKIYFTILDNNGYENFIVKKDVTKEIKCYMGPSEDFYGHDITPRCLGYDELIFEVFTDVFKTLRFGPYDVIKIN